MPCTPTPLLSLEPEGAERSASGWERVAASDRPVLVLGDLNTSGLFALLPALGPGQWPSLSLPLDLRYGHLAPPWRPPPDAYRP